METRPTGLEGKITDKALEDVRSRIGTEFVTKTPPNLEEATKDAIRHWAEAIGDLDPKWTDAKYAESTRFGGITAPPSMLYGFDLRSIGSRAGLPGIHSFFAGADHEWYLPIKRNDEIHLKVVFTDLVEKKSRFAGRMFQQISECTFTNQNGEVVARTWPWGMRTERSEGSSRGKYDSLELAHYDQTQIDEISEKYSHEHELVRGSEPRYWEDVKVGDVLGPFIRGPWTPTVSIKYLQAHGGMFLMSHGYWYDYIRRHPKAAIPNDMGIPEGPVRGHWDSDFARKVGVRAAYDYGPERLSWLVTLCTYWCGDDGWLKQLRAEVRGFNLVGDLTTVQGRVVDKTDDGETGIAHVEISATDQRDIETAFAKGQISLPKREKTSNNG
jgi:acyl dehydratase